jgi:hypothetical protein
MTANERGGIHGHGPDVLQAAGGGVMGENAGIISEWDRQKSSL